MQPRVLPDWAALPAARPGLQVCVVVPVRDESRRLAATLRALAQQVDELGAPVAAECFEVILLANNCQDGSAAVARRFAHSHPTLALHVVEVRFPTPLAHVGHARACLMNEACRRLRSTAGANGVIASTDGDTRVDRRWLATTLAEFAAGADAVGGLIASRAVAGDSPALRALVQRDAQYRHWRARLECLLDPDTADPWPRHHHHFGASLAVRVGAYEVVGGCPPVPWLEDEALVRALRGRDLRVRHSPRVRVVTSGRRLGRVEVGLSQQLRAWAAMAEAAAEPLVPDPEHEAATLRLRARLRTARPGDLAPQAEPVLRELAAHLGLPSDSVTSAWQQARFFGAFFNELAARTSADALPLRRLGEATCCLRDLVNAEQARASAQAASRPGVAASSVR